VYRKKDEYNEKRAFARFFAAALFCRLRLPGRCQSPERQIMVLCSFYLCYTFYIEYKGVLYGE
jgi:hypothetical protein